MLTTGEKERKEKKICPLELIFLHREESQMNAIEKDKDEETCGYVVGVGGECNFKFSVGGEGLTELTLKLQEFHKHTCLRGEQLV